MRIAIYHNLPSGGGKRALYEVTRRLAERHEIDVYTLSTADHDFCDLRPRCREHVVFPFNPLPLARSPFGRLNQGIRALDLLRLRALQKRVALEIDRAGYDVVFVHHCRFGQSPGVLSFLETSPIYYCQEPPRSLHEPQIPRPYGRLSLIQRAGNRLDPLPGLYRRLLARLDAKNVSGADVVLVNSHFSRESFYRTYGIFSRVCYLGVDTDRFRPLSLPRDPFVLSVGHLTPRKGFDFLIKSLALMDSTRRPNLIIVSDFENLQERRYLEGLAEGSGVGIQFRTRITDEELVRLYNQARLTACSPIMEPFGFVPLESMACSTPVVGVQEAGLRESVPHGRGGLLTDRHPGRFAEAVESLYHDDERRRQYGEEARAYVEQHWQWERCVCDVEAHLSSLLRDQSGNGVVDF